ncbi:cation efflux family-domain-containing protein [Coniella lustricola]|uniref:Cation efflux family-domain-containing protein n=1 Tax=Coniella lustricola TaxID=2025994 RepID=A0A2T2ZXT4_9PEZI|nr:cation efflux family-domain-containing protein [Coniella lustricola]
MEPNLSRSITAHPHLFELQHMSHTSHSPRRSHDNHTTMSAVRSIHSSGNAGASSTALDPQEAMGHDGQDNSTHARHVPSQHDHDIEGQKTGKLPTVSVADDPFGLAQGYKTEQDLQQIKANMSKKRGSRQPSAQQERSLVSHTTPSATAASIQQPYSKTRFLPSFGREQIQYHRIQGFYTRQNETIERLLKTVEEHVADAKQEEGDDKLKVRIAIWGSFAANVILCGLQLFGAITSSSLSLFTTMADAIFDPLSNITLIVSNRAVKRVDPSRFPSGKARLETIGNIVFCFLMTSVSLILIAFSCKELISREGEGGTNTFHLASIIAVCVAFCTKFVLFLYTWALKDKYSQVDILWQDHRNDLLINGFGIMTSVGGAKLAWWLDPMGSILISLIVSFNWLRTAFAEFLLLVGVAASVETQQLITYVCCTHSPAIKQIDTVRVYHSGPRLIAEVDVVMDPNETLQETHDVAEDLQIKLESLPDIERAYVHVDYETTHKPEHAWKKDL